MYLRQADTNISRQRSRSCAHNESDTYNPGALHPKGLFEARCELAEATNLLMSAALALPSANSVRRFL